MKNPNSWLDRTSLIVAALMILLLLLSIGCNHKRTAQSLNSERTQEDYYREFAAWLKKQTADPYRTGGHQSPEWDDQAQAFLNKMCDIYARKSAVVAMAELEKEAQSIVQLGCNDPSIGIWYGYALYCNKKYEEADYVLKDAMGSLGQWDYPHSLAFLGATFLRFLGEDLPSRSQHETTYWQSVQIETIRMAIESEEFTYGQSPIAFRLITNGLPDESYIQLADAVEGITAIDPWLLKMLDGISAIASGWKARGDGWARTVSNEGWDTFHTQLEAAQAVLLEAWNLHPERPEAAGRLIVVSMAGHAPPNTDEHYWFEQATTAQIDYPDAYTRYLYSLMPRWGGSHDAMYQFGLECLNGGRFDTRIPLVYHYALVKIAGDYKNDRWRLVFRKPEVHDNLDRLFGGMIAHTEHPRNLSRLRLVEAATTAWCGRYADASRLLATIENKEDFDYGFWGLKTTWQGRELEVLETEVRAFTGPQKETLKRAEKLAHGSQMEEGVSLFEEAMIASRMDQSIHDYLRRRIALSRFNRMAFQIEGRTPALQISVSVNDLTTAGFLLDNGLDVNATDSHGMTALHYAARKGNVKFVRWLIEKGANVNALNNTGWSPLQEAIHAREVVVAELLIERGANLNLSIDCGWTPLASACYLNLTPIVRLAIEKGADIDHLTGEHWSPLHLAIFYGSPETATYLINAGCDINLPNGDNLTPLEIALTKEHSDLALSLIRKGANIDIGPNPNFTPIHIAAEKGFLDVVKELDARGVDLKARLPNGASPLDIAIEFNRDSVAAYLVQKAQ